MSNLVLIEQALKESSYDRNHIAYLARKGFIKGEKHGGVWLIDLDSLKEYEAQMQEEGENTTPPSKGTRNIRVLLVQSSVSPLLSPIMGTTRICAEM